MRAIVFALTLIGSIGPVAAEPLAGDALKTAVAGKRIFLAIPLGGEFPLRYLPDGRLEGTSPNSLLARLDPTTDTGRWWVKGTALCQVWRHWYEGRRYCFTLETTGARSLSWVREDGLSGKARTD